MQQVVEVADVFVRVQTESTEDRQFDESSSSAKFEA